MYRLLEVYMPINVGTDKMRKKMGEILDCVYLRGDEYIIERKNKPLAALIPISKLLALTEAANSFLIEFMEKQATDLTTKELNSLIEDTKIHVRQKRQ